MAAADRQTLAAIFHHPVAQNLSWMDALRLMTHLGSSAMPELIRQKITFGEMRASGVRGVLVAHIAPVDHPIGSRWVKNRKHPRCSGLWKHSDDYRSP
jgi:hypothetical protein